MSEALWTRPRRYAVYWTAWTVFGPHFLFSTLNAIMVLARRRRDERGDALVLEVEDDGPGPSQRGAGDRAGNGIGLANTRARLPQLYGDRASLTLASREGGGAVATMVVPFHLASELPS